MSGKQTGGAGSPSWLSVTLLVLIARPSRQHPQPSLLTTLMQKSGRCLGFGSAFATRLNPPLCDKMGFENTHSDEHLLQGSGEETL